MDSVTVILRLVPAVVRAAVDLGILQHRLRDHGVRAVRVRVAVLAETGQTGGMVTDNEVFAGISCYCAILRDTVSSGARCILFCGEQPECSDEVKSAKS